ncbi:MAG TPA: sulfurtransferase TusA family protein [Nitrososphaerales archaeon]|nr:sulfurtransferase TusA family protein [Nitrososphaerales archaeon]
MELVAILSGNDRKKGTPTMSVEEATGEDFVVALSDRDSERLEACFHPEVRMRALVPSGLRELSGTSDVVAQLNSWFAEAESIQVLEKNVYRVADRLHIRYRFREHYSDGETEIIEQDAYCDLLEGQIATIDLLCSGHRPELQNKVADLHHFYAGDLGCSSGLPEEFRRQINSIPVGSNLEISTRDPSAKEDLPSLTRLLGHRVISISNSPDGTVLVVQRGH